MPKKPKPKPKPKREWPECRIIQMTWLDAVGTGGGLERGQSLAPVPRYSIGVLVEATEEYVTICQTIDEETSYPYDQVLTVPAGMIEDLREVELEPRKRTGPAKKPTRKA